MEAGDTRGGKNPGPEGRVKACVRLRQVDLAIPGHRFPPVTVAIVMEEFRHKEPLGDALPPPPPPWSLPKEST